MKTLPFPRPRRPRPPLTLLPGGGARRSATPASAPPVTGARPADAGDRGLELWRRAVAARWPLLTIVLSLSALGLAAAAAAAPAGTTEEPETGLRLRGGPDGVEIPAPVLATEVSIRVTGPLARARVRQRFFNPGETWMEGVYTFPLPADAAVDGLRLVIGERVLEGQIHEREEARRIYRKAKQEGVKASLVGQKRPNLFTTRVANVGPGEQVEVVLEYQQTLRWDSGSFRLRFPMTVTPRYSPAGFAPLRAAQDAAAPVVQAVQPWQPWQTVQTVLDRAFAAGSPNPLRLSVDLDAGFPLRSLSSRHHDFDIQLLGPGSGSGDHYHLALLDGESAEVPADRDLELVWEPERGAKPRSTLFSEEIDGDTYALLMVLPPDPEDPGFSRLPRETIFVIDTSGSMGGASILQAKAALISALQRLQPEDSFNVLAFSSSTRALFPGSWPASPEVIERARVWVEHLRAGGGTEMLPALLAALDGRPDGYGRSGARAVKQVIFITDGAVANEDQLFSAIERHLGEARLFPVAIGSAPNGYFLLRAAVLGRGTATFIGNPYEVESRMGELFTKLESPALTGVEVMWDDPGAQMYPPQIPDLYAGEPVVVAARLLSLGEGIRVTGERDGSFWEQELSVARLAESTASGAVTTAGIGKLWARRAIETLMDELRRAPGPTAERPETAERDELRRRVVELALTHHLVSRFTSLVAVDVTPTRPAGERLARHDVPNTTPAGWVPGAGQLPAGATGWRLWLLAGLLLLGMALVAAALLLAAPRRRLCAGEGPTRRTGWTMKDLPLAR